MASQSATVVARAVGLMLLATVPASAQDIEVRLSDGSVRRGVPEAAVTDNALRLRSGSDDAYIIYSVDWSRVTEVRDGEQVWPAERLPEFRDYLAKRSDDAEISLSRDGGDQRILTLPPSSRPLWQSTEQPGPSEPRNGRVAFIDIDAVAANWNAGVPWDGIVLRVWPLNQRGEVVRVSGTLTVTLYGERGRATTRHEQLGYWVRAVRPADFGSDGLAARFEYQASHPERWDANGHWDHAIEPYGEVHVRLAIPGQGVFRASTQRPLRLRRYSAVRDRLFMNRGERLRDIEY